MSTTPGPGTFVTPSIELTRRIGVGGMGTIWIATHHGLRKDVAVKLMAASILSSTELRMRFAQEAAAAANVKSPHVIHVYDTGVSEDLGPYLVMELLEGEDLGERLERVKVLPPEDVARIVAHAAHALDRAHAIGIVHRDIKPANLFLCDEPGAPFNVKVLDFGVARLRLDALQHTSTGVSLGTPSYMSPEQAAAEQDLDGTSDLYALGLVAFRALTGAPAYHRESLEALGLGVYKLPPPKLTDRRSTLPPAIDAWFARACALDRKARFADGATMAAELVRVLGTNTETPARVTPANDDDAPRSDGPTRDHVPAQAPAPTPPPVRAESTQTGLSQPTVPGAVSAPSPPARRGRTAIALAAALGAIAIVGWSLVERDGRSTQAPAGTPASASAPTAASSPVAEAAAADVPLGVLLDLSGERRHNGQKLLAATVAAETLVNRSGGIRGRKLRLVVRDNQGDTGAFLQATARALLDEPGMKVIIGPITSQQVALVAPLAQKAGVIELASAATSPEFTTLQRPDERILFRTVPSQTRQATALAYVMRGGAVTAMPQATGLGSSADKPASCASVAIVASDDLTNRPFAEVLTRSLTARGGRVVVTRLVDAQGQASYEAELQAVAGSGADCLVLALGPKDAARYLRQSFAESVARADTKRSGGLRTFAVNNLATSDFIAYARENPRDPKSLPSLTKFAASAPQRSSRGGRSIASSSTSWSRTMRARTWARRPSSRASSTRRSSPRSRSRRQASMRTLRCSERACARSREGATCTGRTSCPRCSRQSGAAKR